MGEGQRREGFQQKLRASRAVNFDLTEEQQAFQDSVRAFAERHLAADALARAHDPKFPWDVARLMAGNSLFGLMLPEKDGGGGGTLLDAVLAIEQIAKVCPRSADVFQAGNFGAFRTLAEYATPDQKQRFFGPLLRGEKIAAVAMTEADAGSALTDLASACRPDGNGYRLSGGKVFTSNTEDAEIFLVYCRFGPGTDGIGSVIVERGMEGFRLGAPSRYMNGEDWCALYFDEVFVPPENVVLKDGGFRRQIAGLNVERIGNAARARALGEYCFAQARAHAEARTQFGRKLMEFQGLQWKFAEMRVALDAAQLLLYRAAVRADRGLPDAQDVAIAKYACNQAGWLAANESMQVMGGTGYSQDLLIEYCVRKTRGWMIAGGSLEMMKNRIAEGVFGRSFSQRSGR
jgi:alkylation response protein AidB-like acyl-CoA dehydrogenase